MGTAQQGLGRLNMNRDFAQTMSVWKKTMKLLYFSSFCRSSIEEDHNYVCSPTRIANSAPGSPDQPTDHRAPPTPKTEGSDWPRGGMIDRKGRGRPKKGSTGDSVSMSSGSSGGSRGLHELIRPVSVKLENCLLQVLYRNSWKFIVFQWINSSLINSSPLYDRIRRSCCLKPWSTRSHGSTWSSGR